MSIPHTCECYICHNEMEDVLREAQSRKNAKYLASLVVKNMTDITLKQETNGVRVTVEMSLKDYFKAAAIASGQCPYNSHEHDARAKWAEEEAEAMLK